MSTPWSKVQEQLAAADAFRSEFNDIGFDVDGEPSKDGWVPVHLPERWYGTEDKNRSGSVNVNTGFIHNFRDGSTLSLWDWMVEHDLATTWKEAQDRVLRKYGLATTYSTKNAPQYKVKWEQWDSPSASNFCSCKGATSLGGILRSGAVCCRRLGEPLFAWKVLDSKMETVGYHFIPRSGGESTIVKGAKAYTKRWKDAESGFIGDPAVAALFFRDTYTVGEEQGNDDGTKDFSRTPLRISEIPGKIERKEENSGRVHSNSSLRDESVKGVVVGEEGVEGREEVPRRTPPDDSLPDGGMKQGIGEVGNTVVGVADGMTESGRDRAHRCSSKTIIWTEGVSDLVALYSKYPDVLALSNPHGCSENVSSEQAALLDKEGVEVWIIADADEPGILGASKKRDQLISLVSKDISVRVFTIPGEVAEKHGKDLRDFLVTPDCPNTWQELSTTLREIPKDDSSLEKLQETQTDKARKGDSRAELRCVRALQTLGLIILSRTSKDCVVYCEHRRAIFDVDLTRLPPYEYFLANVGPRFSSSIDQNPGGRNKSFDDFKKELAIAASSCPMTRGKTLGAGVWGLRDDDRIWQGDVLLVTGQEWKRFDGTSLVGDTNVMYGCNGYVDVNNGMEWLKTDRLSAEIKHATEPQSLHNEIMDHFNSWLWEHPSMAEVAAGLLYATWLQELFNWRPIVSIVGKTHTGKTQLFEMLRELYIDSPISLAAVTKAGVIQQMRGGATPILLDEVDQMPKDTKQILEHFRLSGSNQMSARGTTNQSGKTYQTNHILWIAGIYCETHNEADNNRQIRLALLHPGESRTLNRIPRKRALEMGYQILARMLRVAKDCVSIVDNLALRTMPHYGARFVQNYAVPYGALAAFLGQNIEWAWQKMEGFLGDKAISAHIHSNAAKDWEVALGDILTASINVRGALYSVRHLLFGDLTDGDLDSNSVAVQNLRTAGIAVIQKRNGERRVAIDTASVCRRNGLGGLPSRWTDDTTGTALRSALTSAEGDFQPVTEVIKDGSKSSRRCVAFKFDNLERWANQNLMNLGAADELGVEQISTTVGGSDSSLGW